MLRNSSAVFALASAVRSAPAMKMDFFALVMTSPLRFELHAMTFRCAFNSSIVAWSKMFAAESGRSKVRMQMLSSVM